MSKISVDTPLNELTLRRYERPRVKGRELVRKLCLSIGLLQPGDSRDVIVDILYVLLAAKKEQRMMNTEEIRTEVVDIRRKNKLPLLGIASSNIRRQLRRMKEIFLVEVINNNYRISEFMDLDEIFHKKTEGFLLNSILERVNEYISEIDQEFSDE